MPRSLHRSTTVTPISRPKTATARIAEAMCVHQARCGEAPPRALHSLSGAGEPPTAASRPLRALRLAACDGVNHQDFILSACDFLDAFSGRNVERLRP